jgi:hypothetical protein
VEIERLVFQVSPTHLATDFLSADDKIWTTWLMQKPGYLHKTSQIYPGGVVNLLIYWASKADLDRASKDPQIPIVEARMKKEFSGVYFKLG